MNWKQKRLVVRCSVAVAILIAAVVAVAAYSHALKENPNFIVNISAPENLDALSENGGSYCYTISLDYNDSNLIHQLAEQKNSMDLCEKIQADLDSVQNDVSALEGQYMIEADYEDVGKKTVIIFKGEVIDPDTGETAPFERKFEYDFILTNKINKPDASTYKYIDM